MKRLFWALVLPALAFAGTVQLAGVASADFLDEFSVPQRDPGWGVLREDPTHWSLTARPGFLRIMTQYLLTRSEPPNNFFYHNEGIPGNFEVSVKLIAHPDSAGQFAGIYAGDDSLHPENTRVAVGFLNVSPYGRMVLGMINDSSFSVPYSDTLVYLRIRTSGNTVFAEYSPNNSNWTVLRSGNWPFAEHQMSGVFAMIDSAFGGTRQTPEMNADFDWFHLLRLTGAEEENKGFEGSRGQGFKITPNPFTTFATLPGHEAERFSLYDVSGRKVGTYQGDRVGEGLAPGVYFLRSSDNKDKPLRIVKVR